MACKLRTTTTTATSTPTRASTLPRLTRRAESAPRGTKSSSARPGSRSRSRRKMVSKLSDGMLTPLTHPANCLGQRRGDRPATDLEETGDLRLLEAEVVLRYDDRPLSFRQQREEPARLQAIEHLRELIVRRRGPQSVGDAGEQRPVRSAVGFSQRDPEYPAGEVFIAIRWTPQSFEERLVKSIASGVAIAQGRQQRAIDPRGIRAVDKLPPAGIDSFHHY